MEKIVSKIIVAPSLKGFLFRRDLLREAVSDWLAQAESIKSRLETETEHLGNQEEVQNMRVGGG
jgi:hypothetical protein